MSIKDGGPFHPFQPLDRQGMPCMAAEPGLSLRDHFAGLAMQGYCANPDPQTATSPQERIADWAYAQADAMLRAREAGQ